MSPATSVPHTTSLHFNNKHYEGDNILDGWANYFESLGAPSNSPMDSNHIHILNVFQSLSTLPSDDPDVFVEDEVAAVIKSLPLRKSAGPDHITYEHLIYAGPILPKVLTILFNAILCSAYIPSTFKHGYVIPLPKSHNKPLNDPSNYRGISLLSCISKLFEKLLLLRLGDVQKSLNPLQGGFRSGVSCVHSAFVFQEAVASLREKYSKVYVAFIDVKKAFDTVWQAGLMVKLHSKNIPSHLWHLLNNWYHQLTSSVIWNADISRPFPIHQGVRQGAILSPLLYSVFVDELLDILSSSGQGVFIDDIFCGAPMYADDLALISDSPEGLQHMLDTVSSYAHSWRYAINAQKSAILVLGESPRSRQQLRSSRSWYIQNNIISESDSYHHLGILRSVHTSTVSRTVERCSVARSTFFALNAVGSRFGCLHPLTSFRLYSSFCLPILLYGCELWCITKTEITMLERVHRKILRTIQGLPLRCPAKALQILMGTSSILSFICKRQLTFVHSFSTLPPDSLPRRVLESRAKCLSLRGIIPTLSSLLEECDLPSINSLMAGSCSRLAWKKQVKRLYLTKEFLAFLDECDHLPLSLCSVRLGSPVNHWRATLGLPILTRQNNFRLRLLVGCDGLEQDASRFRQRKDPSSRAHDASCKLCLSEPEDAPHFISRCPALTPACFPL